MPDRAAMLKENECALVLRLALPGMAAMLASSLCTLLDGLLLSRSGAHSAAAASVCFPLIALIQTIGFTLGMGAGSSISRSLGSGEQERAQRAASTAFFGALALSCALCGAAFPLAAPLVRLLGAPQNAVPLCALYARFVLSSAPLLCMNLTLSSILRALGRTAASMAAFLGGSGVGAALQYLLILRLNLGVAGSGAAMLIREIVTLLILLFAVYARSPRMRPRPGLFTPTKAVFADIMRSGTPTLLRQGLTAASSMMLSRISAGFGEAALSGMSLAVRAVSLITSAVIGFGQGFQPVCGYAMGAGNLERIRRAYRLCMRCVVLALLAAGVLVFLFGPSVLSRFSQDAQAALFAKKALRVQSFTLFAQGAVIMMNMLAQSMGFPVRASVIAASRQGFVFIALLLILPRIFGEAGLLLAQSVSDLISLALCCFVSRSCLPRERRSVTRSSCGRCGYWDARKASQ